MYILWLILPLLVSACLALYLHACVCVCVCRLQLELQAEVGVPTADESCPNLLTLSVADEKHELGIPALTTPERTRHFS